jgi:hypothetical protein
MSPELSSPFRGSRQKCYVQFLSVPLFYMFLIINPILDFIVAMMSGEAHEL